MKIQEPKVIGFEPEMEIYRRKKPDNQNIETVVEKGILKYIEDTRQKTAIVVKKTIEIQKEPCQYHRRLQKLHPFEIDYSGPSEIYSYDSDASENSIIANEARGFDLVKKVLAKNLNGSERLVSPIAKKDNSFYYEFINPGDGYPSTLMSMLPWLSPSETFALFNDGLCGLAALHNQKIQHGDFKPHQILVGQKGAKLSDYTYTRSSTDEVLGHDGFGMLAGTPIFLSPDHYIYGKWWQNDVYAIGASLKYIHTATYREFATGPKQITHRFKPVRFEDSRDTEIEFLYKKLMDYKEANLTPAFACNAIRIAILKKTAMCFFERD